MGTTLGNTIRSVVLFAALGLSPPSPAQQQSLGVVQQANLAHVGQTAVITEGTTIFAGEALSTDAGGMLELQIAASHFGLPENSRAAFYPRAKGSTAELRGGTLTFRRDAGGADIEVVASDVRVVPKGDGAVTGQVTIVSPCKITVTSLLGQLDVTSGKETHTINEKETYSVIPEVSVLDGTSHVSPDDSGYHESHTHKACAAPPLRRGGPPVGAGSSRFLLLGGAAVGILVGLGIWKHLESPDKP